MTARSGMVSVAAASFAIGATLSASGVDPILNWDMDTLAAAEPPNDIVADLGTSGLDGLVMSGIGITRVTSGGPFATSPAYYTHPGPGAPTSQGIQVLGAQTALDVTNSYSISAWFQGHDATAAANIAGRYDGGAHEGFVLRYEDDEQVSFFHRSNTDFNLIFGVGPAITDTNWHHLVGVFEEGAGSTLWLDGQIVGTDNTTTSGFGFPPLTPVFMVGSQDNAPNRRPFASGIDEVKLYDFALNEEQVLSLYTFNSVRAPVTSTNVTVNDTLGVSFSSEVGRTYVLQSTPDLVSSNFSDTGAIAIGNGGGMTLFDPTGPSTSKNYRVVQE